MEDDGAQKAPVIVVLGGDDTGDRIIEAAQLAQAGYAPYILVDGPPTLLGHECDVTIQYAIGRGFPEKLFRPFPLPAGLNSTRGESQYVGNYLRKRGISKMLLVTSNFHTRRAARLFRKQSPGLQVVVVPAPDPYFTPSGWWKTRDGQKTLLFEWMKTVAAWLGV